MTAGRQGFRLADGIRSCVLLLAALLVTGCAGMFSKSAPPEYYQIDYPFQSLSCSKPFPGAVRIWNFSASAPFDREQMLVVSPSLNVRFSSNYKWIAPPGNMLADKLIRDLSRGSVFQDAVPVGNPLFAAYEMSGRIYKFALEENGSPPHAVLDLEISLWQEKPVRSVLFRKNFHYESPPLQNSDPTVFANAIASLVAQLSLDLRNDLCSITPDNSRQAGG